MFLRGEEGGRGGAGGRAHDPRVSLQLRPCSWVGSGSPPAWWPASIVEQDLPGAVCSLHMCYCCAHVHTHDLQFCPWEVVPL